MIAAPDHLHASLALACLEVGKPAFVEKPLATQIDQAKKVVEAEVLYGSRMIQLGFMRQYDPPHVDAKLAVDSGDLGARLVFRGVHRFALHEGPRTVDELMVNSMIHDFHSARWMMEDEVNRVFAQVLPDTAQSPGTARLGLVQLQFQKGTLGFLEWNSSARYGYEVEVEIICDAGTVTTNFMESPYVKRDSLKSQRVTEHWRKRFEVAYRLEIVDWIQRLCCGRLTGPSVWDGYMSMLMAQACIDSALKEMPVEVPKPARPKLYC